MKDKYDVFPGCLTGLTNSFCIRLIPVGKIKHKYSLNMKCDICVLNVIKREKLKEKFSISIKYPPTPSCAHDNQRQVINKIISFIWTMATVPTVFHILLCFQQ